MVSDDPIKAAIQANRDNRLRAAACYNQKSLKSAATESINLFILDQESVDKLDFSTIVGGDAAEPASQKEAARPAFKMPSFSRRQQKSAQKEQPAKKSQKRSAPEPDEDESAPRDGISGRIKDIFGIMDE